MSKTSRVIVHVDERGHRRVEVVGDGHTDAKDFVAEKPDETVAPFRDEEYRATRHLRHGGL